MSKKKRKTIKTYRFRVSANTFKFFGLAAVALALWAVWLSHTLPSDHLDRHWNWAWSGLDIGEFIALALTAYLGIKKSGWTAIAATTAGSLLLVDAWFDSLTARRGWENLAALSLAVFVELPLAFFSLWVAYRVGKMFFK